MPSTFLRLLACCIYISIASVAGAAPAPVFSNGFLVGADDVLVRGKLFDVRFVDGTCVDAYGSCTTDRFAFDYDGAVDAAWALLDSVLIDADPQWPLDSVPQLVGGCSALYQYCQIFTPARFEVQGGTEFLVSAVAINAASPSQGSDWVVSGLLLPDHDTTPYLYRTWAVWTEAPTATVPVPASSLLLITGLSMTWAIRRSVRRKRAVDSSQDA